MFSGAGIVEDGDIIDNLMVNYLNQYIKQTLYTPHIKSNLINYKNGSE